MKLQIIQPQEVEVFYILPAIRSGMAAAMKKQGMSQKDIARLLCVQESTISQYLSSKRAADVKFNDSVNREISAAVKRIKTKVDLVRETQSILEMIRSEKLICKVHESVADLPEGCDACFFGLAQKR
ncbi:helix-turn-helix domain-containing protein [Candidatus Woesearchaeota archaeon]|nr:helix-turn-helix domain-containing protein [Candidatus Woesearchaeota archaeon]